MSALQLFPVFANVSNMAVHCIADQLPINKFGTVPIAGARD
jgi:hypothetical protein